MVAIEHYEVIKGTLRFVSTDNTDSEEVAEDGSIDSYGASSDEEDESGLVEVGVRTDVTQFETEKVEGVQLVVKYIYPSNYMLKPPSLIKQGFNRTKKAQ